MTPRAIKSFSVRTRLPEALQPLAEIAANLRWSWDSRTRDLFRWVDPKLWPQSRHNPVELLGSVAPERFEALVEDASFMDFLAEVHAGLKRYRDASLWFQSRDDSPLRCVAYFSPEFGICEALPQYSGGLGVLAGDHLKAASDLGVPIIGVGLFYRQGYFRQRLDASGWQQETYVDLDPHVMALEALDVRVSVDMAGRIVSAAVWRAEVGRVPLLLLDTDIDENSPDDRAITDRLYGGDVERRIEQEILLGIGGTMALEVAGESPQIFHMNEGHAGFLALARIAKLVSSEGLTFSEAVEAVRSSTVFTTHTPVPAGIDVFPLDTMERYFRPWAEQNDLTFNEVMALGRWPDDTEDAPFNMAVMGMKLSSIANGVSKLHGSVSRTMFQRLWSGFDVEEVPIGSVTNGVHGRTWVLPETASLLERVVLPQWEEAAQELWEGIASVTDEELWRVREQGRERLVGFVRKRLRESAIARGAGEADLTWCEEALDPKVLTIGWARRFATYKRPGLLLLDTERLKGLLLSKDHPVQLIMTGKAHPADDAGKELIREIVGFSVAEDVRHRIAFLEDYDIEVARYMYQGADVWLNTPRRPLEACGTSGEKAALNGSLNCSILDGWWDEMFDGENGWSIASAESDADPDRRDQVEASALFDLLERRIVPLYYERPDGGVPHGWLERVKKSLISLGPRVGASRMVRDYVEAVYEPAAARSERLASKKHTGAKGLASWKQRVTAEWSAVEIELVDAGGGDGAVTDLGGAREVKAVITLGEIGKDEVEVQLLHGLVATNDELTKPEVVRMNLAHSENGRFVYSGSFICGEPGRYGFTVRVVPSHSDLTSYAETGLVAWA